MDSHVASFLVLLDSSFLRRIVQLVANGEYDSSTAGIDVRSTVKSLCGFTIINLVFLWWNRKTPSRFRPYSKSALMSVWCGLSQKRKKHLHTNLSTNGHHQISPDNNLGPTTYRTWLQNTTKYLPTCTPRSSLSVFMQLLHSVTINLAWKRLYRWFPNQR